MQSQIKKIEDWRLESPIWFFMSFKNEIYELENAILRFELDSITSQELNTKFDIVWSRNANIPSFTVNHELYSESVASELMEYVDEDLRNVEALIINIEERTTGELRDLAQLFRGHANTVNEVTLIILDTMLTNSMSDRTTFSTLSRTSYVLIFLLFLGGFSLVFVIIGNKAESKRALLEKDGFLRQARAAGVAKSEFISVMNHELRTPLTSINAAVDLVYSGKLGKVPSEFLVPLDIAYRNCKQLGALISDTLDYEKLSLGKMEFNFSNIDLIELIDEQIVAHEPFGNMYGVSILRDKSTSCDVAWGDRVRISQVLSNLISNAVKFSSSGSVVELRAKDEGEFVLVSISDNGRGIPSSARERIFEEFQQVDSSNARERGGTGLGLAIVKSIVKAHRGEVDFESSVGMGTTFHFSIPLVKY